MEPEQWRRVKQIVDQAAELAGAERVAYLAQACAGDTELESEVSQLLAEHDERSDPLGPSTEDESRTRTAAPGKREIEETIGPYRVLELLGRGGMGEVYLAEQRQPVKRRVALKVIKRGMDSREVVARFEAERQALALMSHSAIAKVYDAGTTAGGRPFFAMELVRGKPITEFCDDQRLRTEERLRLMLEVCDGVQHAHQKGIIHRDLKPSNILVVLEDDRPHPKIIDFGVAKATAPELGDSTVYTQLGQWIGTPEYMSPEQADPTSLDIDTRTDVYALGVVLYELIVGAKPFDPSSLRQAGFAELRRVIREEEPPKPSTRLSGLEQIEAQQAAENRGLNLSILRRGLQGDLDAIAMKALAKDRTQRYGSPSEFAQDIARHLNHEAVLASPPSGLYRARKFVRRHRLGVAISALLLFFLAAFAIGMSIQSARVMRERDRAETEAARASAFNRFMEETVLAPDPEEGLGRGVTIAETLSEASTRIEELSSGQPEVEATLRGAIGWAFLNLGRYDEAEPLLRSALDIRQRILGPHDLDTSESQLRLGELLEKRGEYDASIDLHTRAVEVRRKVLEADDVRLAEALDYQAEVLLIAGRYQEAELALQEALTINRAAGKVSETADALNKLGLVALNREDLDAAETHLREAIAVRRTVAGDDRSPLAPILNNLGILLYRRENYAQAEEVLREVLEVQREVYGETHEEVATAMGNLAAVIQKRGQYQEAERFFRGALAIHRAQQSEDHMNVAITQANLGRLLVESGRAEQACPILEQAFAKLRAALDPGHWRVGAAQQAYGTCLGKIGRFSEGERLLEESIRLFEETLGPESPRAESARSALEEAIAAEAKARGAEPE